MLCPQNVGTVLNSCWNRSPVLATNYLKLESCIFFLQQLSAKKVFLFYFFAFVLALFLNAFFYCMAGVFSSSGGGGGGSREDGGCDQGERGPSGVVVHGLRCGRSAIRLAVHQCFAARGALRIS